MNTASTSGLGSLPSNTVANPKGKLKAITTRSGLVTDGPTILTPLKSVTPEEDECVEETYMDPDLAEYTIMVPPPPVQKHKPPFQRNFVLHTKDSPEYPCQALTDLGASINLMPLSVWKNLGLPDLIPTRMTLEVANRVICTPDGITRDVFVPVGKFTFPADFVVVDYESDPRVPLILGRPFLRTARALTDVHGEEMILRDGDEKLTFNMKHDTASYSNHPHRESANLINIFNVSNIDSFNDIHPYFDDNPLSDSTTYLSNSLLEEFTDELALITYPPDYDDNLQFDIESDLREIEFLLYQEIESDADNFYDDHFDSKREKIKESKLLIDKLDLPCDFLPYSEPIQEDPPPEVPTADNRTMAKLLQAPTEDYEDAIVIPKITANNFELKQASEHFNDLLRVCPHHGFFELHQLDTFYNALNVNDQDSLNSAAGGNFLDKMPRECLKIIESKSKVRQSRAKAVVAKVSTSSSTPAISSDVAELKDMVKALFWIRKTNPQNMQSQGQSTQNQCQNIQNQYQNLQIQMATLTDMMSKFMSTNTASSSGSGTLPGNTITNPKEELKGITTRSGVAYQGPKTPSPSKQGTKVTKDQMQTPSSQNTAPVQPSVIQSESQASVSEPVVSPVSTSMC
nr:reverse transcriptase domain-containing protein [Tanacetum cinerariifolium]